MSNSLRPFLVEGEEKKFPEKINELFRKGRLALGEWIAPGIQVHRTKLNFGLDGVRDSDFDTGDRLAAQAAEEPFIGAEASVFAVTPGTLQRLPGQEHHRIIGPPEADFLPLLELIARQERLEAGLELVPLTSFRSPVLLIFEVGDLKRETVNLVLPIRSLASERGVVFEAFLLS